MDACLWYIGHRAMQLIIVATQQRISVHLVVAEKRRASQERQEGTRKGVGLQCPFKGTLLKTYVHYAPPTGDFTSLYNSTRDQAFGD